MSTAGWITQYLTRDEERALCLRVRAWLDGDPDDKALAADGIAARNELIERNMPLVIWVINKYLGASLPGEGDDDIQEGVLGLNRAAEKFDPARETRFTTYAVGWILNFVQRSRRDRTLIRMPAYLSNGNKITERQRGYRDATPTRGDYDPDVADLILNTAPAPEDATHERPAAELLEECLDAANLTVRERRIVLALHGVGGEPMTLEALGVELGTSKERVRQIKEKAWKKVWLGARQHARLATEIDEHVRAV